MNAKLTSFFRSCPEYREAASRYTRVDALLGLFYYAAVLVSYLFMAKIFVDHAPLTESYIFCITAVFSICTIAFALLLCALRRQSLRTVGLSLTGNWPSIRCGLRSGLAVAAVFLAIALSFHYKFQTTPFLLVTRPIYYLVFIAFEEELIFRAFLGARLYGVMCRKWLSIVITAVLFSCLHIPFQLVLSQKSLLDFLAGAWPNLCFTFGFHFILQLQYAKYNRIAAPVLFHFAWDFMLWFAMNPVQ